MDYVNTSHPNFIGGSKAVDIVSQQMKSQKLAAVTAARLKVGTSFAVEKRTCIGFQSLNSDFFIWNLAFCFSV